MKKFLLVVMVLMLGVMFGADKPVAVKPVPELKAAVKVVTAEVTFTYADWREAQRKATLADDALEFPKAVELYQKYAKIGEALGRKDLKAWGLNNAAYCIIKMHKNNKTVDLNKAKEMLDAGLASIDKTDKAVEDIVRCIESNLGYVTYWLGLKTDVKPIEIKKPAVTGK